MATNIPPHNMREVIDGVLALIELKTKRTDTLDRTDGPPRDARVKRPSGGGHGASRRRVERHGAGRAGNDQELGAGCGYLGVRVLRSAATARDRRLQVVGECPE